MGLFPIRVERHHPGSVRWCMISAMRASLLVSIHDASRLVAALLLLGLLWPVTADAQSAAGNKRRSANGREFPSWEREDDSADTHPLPIARQGRHVLYLSIPLDGPTTGVVKLDDGSLLVVLLDGRVQRFSTEGELLSEVALPVDDPLAPLASGSRGLIAAARSVTAVDAEGVAWTLELAASLAFRPVVTPAGLSITLEDGSVGLVDPETGRRLWDATIEGASCGPTQSGERLAWGTNDGRIVALGTSDGSELWTVSVADSVASVGADESSVYFSGKGETGRSKKSRGPFVARLSITGRRPEVAWRSRVGGISEIAPMPLDEVVAFACFDGYVHAHLRRSGALAWRTDLPARVTVPPRLFGGRLDYLLPLTGWAVAIAADNGGLMGYTELPDPDETFVGSPVLAGVHTIVATSFGRLVGLRWEYEGSEAPKGDAQGAQPSSAQPAAAQVWTKG